MKNSQGYGQDQRYQIGTICIRTRYKRRNEQRAFIKIDEPSRWVLYARFIWETEHGPIPPGMGIHHKDGNTLNDKISNLELVTKAMHLNIHMPEYREKAIASFIRARRQLKWSTKSKTKLTGRHPFQCRCPLHSG